MAHLIKTCSCCGKSYEPTTEFFHRNKSYKDGMLPHCKSCQNKKTEEYRNGIGKNYWYDDNGGGWFREPKNKKKWVEYLKTNWSAIFNCKIYAITNPEGKVYIGMTQYPTLGKRLSIHKSDYDAFKKGTPKNAIPYLWESVDKWGWENHTAILIEEMDTDNRMKGLRRETEYIQQYMNKGISLNKKLK